MSEEKKICYLCKKPFKKGYRRVIDGKEVDICSKKCKNRKLESWGSKNLVSDGLVRINGVRRKK